MEGKKWIVGVVAVVAVVLALVGAGKSHAALISAADVLNDWTQGPTPLNVGPSLNPDMVWTLVDEGIETTNGSGSLMSDFSMVGDSSFSVRVRSIPFPGGFLDNDVWGLAFGFQDTSNHYRLGWGGGGYTDYGPYGVGGTGATGLFFVKQSSGVGTLLFNDSSLLWQNNVDYDVTILRTGDNIAFSVVRVSDGVTLASHTETDSDPVQGHVGVYVDSQTTRFTDFDVSPIPEPSTLIIWSLLGTLGIAVGWWRRRKST